MELLFEKKTMDCLGEIFYEVISQEETAEAIVPDSYPDAQRIVDSFASVVIRGKELQGGHLTVSGGIHAGVLFVPEEQNNPKVLHYYIPFTIKCENSDITENTKTMMDCYVRSVDARIVNPRKIMVRVNLAGSMTGYEGVSQQQYVYTEDEASDLQIKTNDYQSICVMEVGEKTFAIAEEMELPSGRDPMQELVKYQTDLDVTETKMVGNKGAFKGVVTVKLLYLTDDEALSTWSCQLPFSQYVEFENDYDEQELKVLLGLSDINIEDANGQGKRLLVNMQIQAQCQAICEKSVQGIDDAYSIGHYFTPQWDVLHSMGRLDHQSMNHVVRKPMEIGAKNIIDTCIYMDTPQIRRQEDEINICVPMTANVLYEDNDGQILGAQCRMDAICKTDLAEGCICRPEAKLVGEGFAVPTGEGVEVRCAVGFEIDCYSDMGIRTLCGGELSEETLPAEERPSVILRKSKGGESLWDVAKKSHTTMDVIRKANELPEDAELVSGVFLIPVAMP